MLVNSDKCEGAVFWVLQATGRKNGVVSWQQIFNMKVFYSCFYPVMCCFICLFAAGHSLWDFRILSLWRDGSVWAKPLRPNQEGCGFTVREDEFTTSSEYLSPGFGLNEHKQIHLTFLLVLSHKVNFLMLNFYWWFLFCFVVTVSGKEVFWKPDGRRKCSKGSWAISLLRHTVYRFLWLMKDTSVIPPFRIKSSLFLRLSVIGSK